MRRLAAMSDVLVENFKVGDLKRYGLDYASLRELNPRLVYCSVTGFGQTGPYAPRPGYDSIFQAMGGLMSVTGYPDEEGGAPVKTGPSIADFIGRPVRRDRRDHGAVRPRREPRGAAAAAGSTSTSRCSTR